MTTSFATGLLNDGEVEDYQITIEGVDYGDAPDTVAGTATGDYETTQDNGGAAHIINPQLTIGSSIDADNGRLQNPAASADSADDGITTPFPNLQTDDSSYSVTVNVNNTTGGDATLVGWIDFDQDGLFSSDEAVAATVANNATTATLTWDNTTTAIPTDIIDGTTYARFRLSSDINLTTSFATGLLNDGEVEDYQITLLKAINGNSYSEEIIGTTSNEIITGGRGQDTLTGNGGNDQFVFTKTSDGVDIIQDFDPNGDILDFSAIVADELGGISNPFVGGYIETVSFSSGTMIQVDFNPADSLFNKDVVFLEGVDSSTIDESDFLT